MKRKNILYIVPVIILSVVVIGGLRYAIYNGYIRVNYPPVDKYPVRGIDISHHQGHIDWDKLDKEAVQFIFMKATEGEDHRDSLYAENYRQARRRDIPTASYHFFTFCKSGDVQAQNYISNAMTDSCSLPPVVDLEYGGNCGKENRVDNLLQEIANYIAIVEAHYRQPVIIYTTYNFYDDYLAGQFPDNPVWIRDIISQPELKDGRKWLFWQYTNRGRIEGIDRFVDLNVFYGNKNDFARFRQTTAADTANGEEPDK